ncbi:MAG: hypothetical protein ACRDSR_14265 [Pseudonocardiaceae bacterium]
MIDVPGTQKHQQREPDPVVAGQDGKRTDYERTDDEHPAWCSAEHCYVTDDGVRVHEQAPTRWEDGIAEVRCESRLLDPADESNIYVELELQNLRLGNRFDWLMPLDTARQLRDHLTEHLDAVQ